MRKRLFLLSVLAALLLAVPSITVGQDDPVITVELTPYEGNPVHAGGGAGAWDEWVSSSRVIYQGGAFHMLYQGYNGLSESIGYATSQDGLHWSSYEANPVFNLDPSLGRFTGLTGFTVEDNRWVMYVCAKPYADQECEAVYRVAVSNPTGPWTVEPEPILQKGAAEDWEGSQIWPNSPVTTDGGYWLYYHAKDGKGIGVATSPDGATWTKYDDATTDEAPFASSDPVLSRGDTGAPLTCPQEMVLPHFVLGAYLLQNVELQNEQDSGRKRCRTAQDRTRLGIRST